MIIFIHGEKLGLFRKKEKEKESLNTLKSYYCLELKEKMFR